MVVTRMQEEIAKRKLNKEKEREGGDNSPSTPPPPVVKSRKKKIPTSKRKNPVEEKDEKTPPPKKSKNSTVGAFDSKTESKKGGKNDTGEKKPAIEEKKLEEVTTEITAGEKDNAEVGETVPLEDTPKFLFEKEKTIIRKWIVSEQNDKMMDLFQKLDSFENLNVYVPIETVVEKDTNKVAPLPEFIKRCPRIDMLEPTGSRSMYCEVLNKLDPNHLRQIKMLKCFSKTKNIYPFRGNGSLRNLRVLVLQGGIDPDITNLFKLQLLELANLKYAISNKYFIPTTVKILRIINCTFDDSFNLDEVFYGEDEQVELENLMLKQTNIPNCVTGKDGYSKAFARLIELKLVRNNGENLEKDITSLLSALSSIKILTLSHSSLNFRNIEFPDNIESLTLDKITFLQSQPLDLMKTKLKLLFLKGKCEEISLQSKKKCETMISYATYLEEQMKKIKKNKNLKHCSVDENST